MEGKYPRRNEMNHPRVHNPKKREKTQLPRSATLHASSFVGCQEKCFNLSDNLLTRIVEKTLARNFFRSMKPLSLLFIPWITSP